MDVFSLLNFWRNAGVGGDPITTAEIDFTSDDSSFFDLVFTNTDDSIDSKLNHTAPVFLFNKRKILPLDSSNTRSPFRVLKLGFQNNKSKSDKKKMKSKREIEEVTISSLLKSEKFLDTDQAPSKRFSKDLIHKYLNLIKPFYIKVSGKSNEKVRLRKSRSSAGKLTPSTAARSSDSALQQDGIQSAILHCKKSYSSPTGCDVLSRSGSAPYQGTRISVEELKRISI